MLLNSKSSSVISPCSVAPESGGTQGIAPSWNGRTAYAAAWTQRVVVARHREHHVTMHRLPPSMTVTGVTSVPRHPWHTACCAVASSAKQCSQALSRSVDEWARREPAGSSLTVRGARATALREGRRSTGRIPVTKIEPPCNTRLSPPTC